MTTSVVEHVIHLGVVVVWAADFATMHYDLVGSSRG